MSSVSLFASVMIPGAAKMATLNARAQRKIDFERHSPIAQARSGRMLVVDAAIQGKQDTAADKLHRHIISENRALRATRQLDVELKSQGVASSDRRVKKLKKMIQEFVQHSGIQNTVASEAHSAQRVARNIRRNSEVAQESIERSDAARKKRQTRISERKKTRRPPQSEFRNPQSNREKNREEETGGRYVHRTKIFVAKYDVSMDPDKRKQVIGKA